MLTFIFHPIPPKHSHLPVKAASNLFRVYEYSFMDFMTFSIKFRRVEDTQN